jgi:hypothetical protein
MARQAGWLGLDSSYSNNNTIHISLLHPLVCVSPTLPHHGQAFSENELASVLHLLPLQQQLLTPQAISFPCTNVVL